MKFILFMSVLNAMSNYGNCTKWFETKEEVQKFLKAGVSADCQIDGARLYEIQNPKTVVAVKKTEMTKVEVLDHYEISK